MKKFILSASFLCSTLFATSQNLQLSLSFNGSLTDGAKGRNVVGFNDPTFTTNVKGSANSALALTGQQYLTVDTNFIKGNGSYSVSVWFYSTNLSDYRYILNSGASNDNAGFAVATYNSNIFVGYRTRTTTINNNVGTIPFTVELNKWYHLVGVYNATNEKLSIYINGNHIISFDAVPGNNTTPFPKLYIGTQGNFLMHFFQGKLDELYVYDKALTPNEISVLYNVLVTGFEEESLAHDQPCKASSTTSADGFTIPSTAKVYDVQSRLALPASIMNGNSHYMLPKGLYLVQQESAGCKTKILVQ